MFAQSVGNNSVPGAGDELCSLAAQPGRDLSGRAASCILGDDVSLFFFFCKMLFCVGISVLHEIV